MDAEKKRRKLKTVIFLGGLGILLILLAVIMVQTTSQQNAINSRAGKNRLKEDTGGKSGYQQKRDAANEQERGLGGVRGGAVGGGKSANLGD